jgi:acetyl esterase/lipase
VAVAVVVLVAATLVVISANSGPSASGGRAAEPSFQLPARIDVVREVSETVSPGVCPVDPAGASLPAAEPGVLRVASVDDGPLGGDMFGAGVPNPYYEVGSPKGQAAGRKPKGVMLLIHGGGFVQVGPLWTLGMRADADFWRSQGWETINFDYQGCWQSFFDVLAFYYRVRQVMGLHAVICADGQSTGATLALLLAEEAPGLACVISEAAITDFSTLPGGAAYPNGSIDDGAAVLSGELDKVFGVSTATQMAPFSPITYVGSFSAPVLLATAINDFVIPLTQEQSFGHAILSSHPGAYVDVQDVACPTRAKVIVCGQTSLLAGQALASVPFVHGTTSNQGLMAFRSREAQLAHHVLSKKA